MRKIVYVFCCLVDLAFGSQHLLGQIGVGRHQVKGSIIVAPSKPVVDTFAINHWYTLSPNVAISDDGKWVMYSITNLPFQSNTLVVQQSYGKRKLEFIGGQPGFFTPDAKLFVFMMRDSLWMLTLNTGHVKAISGVTELTRLGERGSTSWVAYRLATNPGKLFIYNLVDGSKYNADSVKDYSFAPNGESILLHETHAGKQSLSLLALPTGNEKQIWSWADSLRLDGYLFDKQGTQLAFALDGPGGQRNIWMYRIGMQQAERKLAFHPAGIAAEYELAADLPTFSGDGRYLYFKVQEPDLPKPKSGFVSLDIWSWTDTISMSTQLHHLEPEKFDCIVNTSKEAIALKLTDRWESIEARADAGDHIVVAYNPSGDRFWLKDNVKNYLVSLKDGKRTLLKPNNLTEFHFSPDSKYLVYFDFKNEHQYIALNVSTNQYLKITNGLHSDMSSKNEFEIYQDSARVDGGEFYRWYSDHEFIVHGRCDPYLIDASGDTEPINLTNGYGVKHGIKFRILPNSNILVAYNVNSRFNGFFELCLTGSRFPKLLTMDSCTYYHSPVFEEWSHSFNLGFEPIKAKNNNVWILSRQSNLESANLIVSRDLVHFNKLTFLKPEKEYNWMTSQLVHFVLPDGTYSQGALFIPENIDFSQKNPVIITYYEQMAQRIYEFPEPALMTSNINVPWFVSRGYVVFCPDIYYFNGNFGNSALNTALGSYNWLCQQNWIDPKRIGIMGHSTGGYETNYIVTHTDKFAAAIAGAGTTDYLSSALEPGGAVGDQGSRLRLYEQQLHTSIHENINKYLANSPILNVNQVATPLIIFHSIKDGAVPWSQALELFFALRRLAKPVWVLQYDNGNHGVNLSEDMYDYSLRITEFFDHYLKGYTSPKWMVSGIPAKEKGITGNE